MMTTLTNSVSHLQTHDPTSESAHPWYGIRTRSNHEYTAAAGLRGKGYDPYLPMYPIRGRTGSGPLQSFRPLFPGYIFCRFDVRKRLPILMTSGIISVLGLGREPIPIPDDEIEAVKAVLQSGLPAEPCAYLREGQRVRVTDGSLEGVQGILVKKKNQHRMVISVNVLERSIAVEIEGNRLAAV